MSRLINDFIDIAPRASEVKGKLPLQNCLMGVELEVDTDSATSAIFPDPDNIKPEWVRKHDGSLANGYEYVLSTPLAGNRLLGAIAKLWSGNVEYHRTYTGSTHIHIDMTDGVTVEQLQTMALMVYVLEDVLYGVGDASRKWCGYANKLASAPREVIANILALSDKRKFQSTITSASRYYGFNMRALIKYGSVEFRYFPTAESPEELISWIKLVQLFKKAAMSVGSIASFTRWFRSKEAFSRFIDKYFAEYKQDVHKWVDYDRAKALLYKAQLMADNSELVISDTNYPRGKLRDKYAKLMKKRRKSSTSKVNTSTYKFMDTTSGVPTPQENIILLHKSVNGVVYAFIADTDESGTNTLQWFELSSLEADKTEAAITAIRAVADKLRSIYGTSISQLLDQVEAY